MLLRRRQCWTWPRKPGVWSSGNQEAGERRVEVIQQIQSVSATAWTIGKSERHLNGSALCVQPQRSRPYICIMQIPVWHKLSQHVHALLRYALSIANSRAGAVLRHHDLQGYPTAASHVSTTVRKVGAHMLGPECLCLPAVA